MTEAEWRVRISLTRNSSRPPWELLDHLAEESESASTWEDFQRWFGQFRGRWCFRGHRMANWFLIASLERQRQLVTAEVGDRTHGMYQPFDSRAHENSLREEFSRRANIELVDSPQWMQHFSTLTTLMDWTYCPSVALYFALEKESSKPNAAQPDKGCALWGIDLEWLEKRSKQQPLHAIVAERPEQPNPRIRAQRGLFLRKVSEERTFTECLLGMLLQPPVAERQVVSKLVLKRQYRMTLLKELERMGIDHDSIYPGPESLDNLGHSLTEGLRTSLAADADEFKQSLVEQIESRRSTREG